MSKINRDFFFHRVRIHLFGGSLSHKQVDGLNVHLDYWEKNHSAKDDRWLAYALATTHHETDKKIQPIREYGNQKYFVEMYDPPPTGKRPKVAKQLGNIHAGDGPAFCGRGYVQLTGRRNYSDWEKRLGIVLTAKVDSDPLKVMVPEIAIKVLFEGMIIGTFTGKKFADYFNSNKEDWEGARKIINGEDKKALIADYGRNYYSAISYKT